ncbi:MAG: hypothetical protein R3357_14450 [Burkholderiales bacterium]|nr:hypothetical protein [Burkholderiales bacterium]
MPPRGSRLACSLRSADNSHGAYDVAPGTEPGSVGQVEPVKWDTPPQQPVVEATFTVIGDFGMTGQVIVLNEAQWRALTQTKLETFFYGALLWGKSPFKVIEDAQLMLRRK